MIDEFLQAQSEMKRPGVVGWWVHVLDQLDDERREALLAVKTDDRVSHRAVSLVLERWGFDVSREKVRHWRLNVR